MKCHNHFTCKYNNQYNDELQTMLNYNKKC